MVNGLCLYSAFPTNGHSKRFRILPDIHTHIHKHIHHNIHAHIHAPTAMSTMQGDSQLVRSSQGEGVLLRDTHARESNQQLSGDQPTRSTS